MQAIPDKSLARIFKHASQGRDSGLGLLQADRYWGDHALYLSILLKSNQAVQALEQKRHKTAVQSATEARRLILTLLESFPNSAYSKKTQDLLVRTEWIEGLAQMRMGKLLLGMSLLERAFFRSGLTQVRREWMAEYLHGALKIKGGTPFTKLWVWELIPIVKKKTLTQKNLILTDAHFESLKKLYPEDTGNDQVPIGPRLTANYKGIEPDIAAFDAAYAIYQDKHYSKSIKAFNALLEEFPKSAQRFRARFWLAQSFTQEQEHDKAKLEYDKILKESPLSYYGMLAAQMSAAPLTSLLAATPPAPNSNVVPNLEPDPNLPPADAFRYQRAQKLNQIKLPQLAATDLKEIRTRDGISSKFLMALAELNFEAGNYSSTFGLLTELIQRSYPEVASQAGIRLIFPTPYFSIIEKNAKEQNLDPLLILSLIKQESAFEAQIASHVGATGLMQLMPTTALDVEADIEMADLSNPADNIRVGTKYLARMLGKYNGNIAFALASYNAGPSAVDRWIREKRSEKGLLEFVEQIPYKETQGYVGSIIRNYYWYSHLAQKPLPELRYFWSTTPSLESAH